MDAETGRADQGPETMVQAGVQDAGVAAGLAVFAEAIRLSPPPRMVVTSQVRYSVGTNH